MRAASILAEELSLFLCEFRAFFIASARVRECVADKSSREFRLAKDSLKSRAHTYSAARIGCYMIDAPTSCICKKKGD